MCSGCKAVAVAVTALALTAVAAAAPAPPKSALPALRVCADPNNLPFTNDRGEGFENAIAELVARDLGRTLEYYWQPQRRGFFRTTIQAHNCDVVMSVPSGFERVRTTRAYYRSAYVFVTRRDRHLDVRSFDDPRLRNLRIGIQLTGDDYANPPAAQALAEHNLTDQIRGYTVYGDYSKPSPQRTIVDAVASGDVDVAIVWGPLAGYFAARAGVPLTLQPIRAVGNERAFAFDISAGVRRDDPALQNALDRVIARRLPEIRRILRRFGVPVIPAVPATAAHS
jgi:quinoprotein dehydrogenase-associated probable ABC transporter substrate-binding protein